MKLLSVLRLSDSEAASTPPHGSRTMSICQCLAKTSHLFSDVILATYAASLGSSSSASLASHFILHFAATIEVHNVALQTIQ